MTVPRLLADLNERAAEAVTVEVCDRELARTWVALRDDPTADPKACRERIDRWLDARLSIMAKAAA